MTVQGWGQRRSALRSFASLRYIAALDDCIAPASESAQHEDEDETSGGTKSSSGFGTKVETFHLDAGPMFREPTADNRVAWAITVNRRHI